MAEVSEPRDRQVFCSGCFQVVSESSVHVIPYYNETAGGYVTTFRCERCWLPALEETRGRLVASTDDAEVTSIATFFERYGVFLHEFQRGDPIPVVRPLLVHMVDQVRSGALRLTIGPTRPL